MPFQMIKQILQHKFYTFSSASTARHLYLRGGVGVGSMIKVYGGRQRNGVCPAHFSVGSRNVARKILQALEGLKMVEKDPNGWEREGTLCLTPWCDLNNGWMWFFCADSGRRLTPQGQRDLDRIAGQVGVWNLSSHQRSQCDHFNVIPHKIVPPFTVSAITLIRW